MKWTLAGLAAVLVAGMQPTPVDACGIKLVIKTSTPRKAVARSTNPSHLLLLGTPPHRLEHELSAAGHDVEVVPSVTDAKRASYAVVVVDSSHADEARTKYPGAVVVVRSGDVAADIVSVENQVARRPVRTDESRTLLAQKEKRQPVAVGPTDGPKLLDSKSKEQPIDKPADKPADKVAVAQDKPAKVDPVPTKKEPVAVTEPQPKPTKIEQPTKTEPAARVAKADTLHDELYFTLGSAAVKKTASLTHAVHFLTDNSGVSVVVEGYADPTGTHEDNLALGQSRAEAVRDFLATAGIDKSRIEVISYGDTRLKYGKSDGRNRRVAIEPKP